MNEQQQPFWLNKRYYVQYAIISINNINIGTMTISHHININSIKITATTTTNAWVEQIEIVKCSNENECATEEKGER